MARIATLRLHFNFQLTFTLREISFTSIASASKELKSLKVHRYKKIARVFTVIL